MYYPQFVYIINLVEWLGARNIRIELHIDSRCGFRVNEKTRKQIGDASKRVAKRQKSKFEMRRHWLFASRLL